MKTLHWLLIISLTLSTTPCLGDAMARAAVSPGKYLLVVNGQPYLLEIGAVPSIEALQVICDVDGPVVPDPKPPVNDFAKRLAVLVNTINEPVLASSLGTLFDTLAEQIESGALKDQPAGHIGDVTSQAIDVLMWASSKQPQWQRVRDAIGAELVKRAQKGTLNYATAYREIAGALTTASNTALNPALIAIIFQIVMAIISGQGISIELIKKIVDLITSRRAELGVGLKHREVVETYLAGIWDTAL